MKKTRRKYNATYRLRKLGVKVNARAKTIYTPPIFKVVKPMKVLMSEFHYVIQTEMF